VRSKSSFLDAFALLTFLVFVVLFLQAQQVDSLFNRLSLDSIPVAKADVLDSIQYSFYGESDSLNRLQLPTNKYAHKLDSLMQQREKAVASLNEKMDSLKSKATESVPR
jgi:hypothetical protein